MLVYVCVCVTLDNMPMKTALFIRFTLIAWRSNRDFIQQKKKRWREREILTQ